MTIYHALKIRQLSVQPTAYTALDYKILIKNQNRNDKQERETNIFYSKFFGNGLKLEMKKFKKLKRIFTSKQRQFTNGYRSYQLLDLVLTSFLELLKAESLLL